ncbi:hypothetical protein Pan189_35700 [Stratiformator vulcanicus]|uniref:Uncharacterized protein n=1 Tax=Stratiformator vulcanicus TaxID=2527980 RepID=A0A517R5J6_9PLAN|nr:hypothetical protein Pan189_35700 [Stratiformator vulcanicus]
MSLPQAKWHEVPPLRSGEGWGEGVRRQVDWPPRCAALWVEMKSKQRCRSITAPLTPHPAFGHLLPSGEGSLMLPQARRYAVPPLRSGEGWGEGMRRRYIEQPR